MHTDEIVIEEMQGHCVGMVLDFLAERIREPGEPRSRREYWQSPGALPVPVVTRSGGSEDDDTSLSWGSYCPLRGI